MSEKFANLLPRFLKYVKVETRSDPNSQTIPSSSKETAFLKQLQDELQSLGLTDVHLNPDNSYLVATIPSNVDAKVPVIGFLAHVDTADFNAVNVNPQVVKHYDGHSPITLGNGKYQLDPAEFPALKNYAGQTLVTTDGTTLLGADDKSGVAEIVTMAEYLMSHPEIKHGEIRIGLSPDEEIGTGADHFDTDDFAADFAYTVDGGPLGELEYETFNAAEAKLTIHGKNVHTGVAKGAMVNAIQVGIDYHNLLPEHDRAEKTEGREGFFHLYQFDGGVDQVTMTYLIRDHDRQKFESRKQLMQQLADQLNSQLDQPRIELTIKDQYYNMREVLDKHMEVVDLAKQAMEDLDIKPVIYPVRGGTDGSTISFMGLPTPNLFAGGENMHSRFEYVSVQTMKKALEVLLKIVQLNVTNNQ